MHSIGHHAHQLKVFYQSNTSLRIFDINGRLIETLIDRKLLTGEHDVLWNASNYASGIYFGKLTVANKVQTQKVIYLK